MSGLTLSQVVKRYDAADDSVPAVDGVSLHIDRGQFIALYGPSGSGKTTLLRMAASILAPDEGSIMFDGRVISDLSADAGARFRREEVGIVFQAFELQGGATALDNASLKLFAMGLTINEAHKRVRPWLERVGLGARLTHPPARMSMGERQRVAIARALANSPRLLLADEPTGNLDSQRSREVLALLRDIAHEQQIPALLVTHDPQATAFVDSVYTLRDGRLSEGLDVDMRPTIVS